MTDTPMLLLALIDVPDEVVEDFHAWYDGEHIPERAAIPGLGPIRRWERRAGDLPRFLATYEAPSAATLESGPYQELKSKGDTAWTQRLRPSFQRTLRGVFALAADLGGSGGRPHACVVALTSVDPADVDAYRSWYDEAHGPLVAKVPGIVRLRRYERDEDPAHLTVMEMTDPAVLDGEDYLAAKSASPAADLRVRWRREQGVYVAGPPADIPQEDAR